jgi:quaternary ammonium compound-resistance protein SugE
LSGGERHGIVPSEEVISPCGEAADAYAIAASRSPQATQDIQFAGTWIGAGRRPKAATRAAFRRRFEGKTGKLPSRISQDRHAMQPLSSNAAWIVLVVAGLLETSWAIGMKYTAGWSKPIPSLLTVAAMIVSMALLGWAVNTIPIGTSYAVWVGIGATGAAILGIVLFGEPVTAARLVFLAMLVVAIFGLKLTAGR